MIALAIFIVCYTLFVILPEKKSFIALGGAALLLLFRSLPMSSLITEVHWNVLGLFLGTLILAELFIHSRMPAVIAERLIDMAPTVQLALVLIIALASVISMGVENVAVVLILAPICLSLCKKLSISPVAPMIYLAIFANLQGTATLIGDPPSMLFGSYMKMSFDQFFFYQGKISIFFFVQVGFLSAIAFVFYTFRKEKEPVALLSVEKCLTYVPSILLTILVVALSLSSSIDPDSVWFAGVLAMGLGIVGILWNHFGPRMASTKQILKELDWKTTLFLFALFILVAAVRDEGWINRLAEWTVHTLSNDTFTIFLFIIILSIVVSAFVDNVPYLLVMMPMVDNLAEATESSLPLFMFTLLLATSLGGNITPIGASANIVAVSFLEKNGHRVNFSDWVPMGLKFTFFATIPACAFLWYIWS